MNHSLTHFFHFLRKNLFRRESRPGNFKRIIVAIGLSQLIFCTRPYIPNNIEESLLIETLFSLRGEISPPDNLAIVSIDDTSYQKLSISPRKPIPREIVAKALQAIQRDNPAVLLLDLYFPQEVDDEVGTNLVEEALQMGPTSISSTPIVTDNNSSELFRSDPKISLAAKYKISMMVSVIAGLSLYISTDPFNFLSSPPEISVPLLKPLLESVNPNLKAPEQYAMVNYYGPPNTIRNFSLWELFAEERVIPKGFFKDKVVLVGFKSELRERGHSDKEILGVPVHDKNFVFEMYGVEIHANIAGNLLQQNWIKRLSINSEIMLLLILLFFLIKGIITYPPKWALFFTVVYLGTWFLGTYIAFAWYGYFIPGVYLALVFSPFIFGGAACVVATLALRELRELKRVFGV